MPTFTWDKLTIHVGEMNRAAALRCMTEIEQYAATYLESVAAAPNKVTEMETALDDQLALLIVLQSPALVLNDGQTVNGTGATVTVDGQTITLKAPLTPETFNALPYSLTMQWLTAAINANGWLIAAAKNLSRTAEPSSPEPLSGSGQ